MVIVRVSQGNANQIYEYMAGYALSQEIGEELVIDISECMNGAWPYIMDWFCIPKVKKIWYGLQPVDYSHENNNGIPDELKKDAKIYTQTIQGQLKYQGISHAERMHKESQNIILNGYFFERDLYYNKFWGKIKKQLVPRRASREIEMFKRLIDGKVPVAIHIRRGDFLKLDWPTHMFDAYYKAAIQWFKNRYEDLIFCVFSNDIEYAVSLLGKDSSIHYIHFFSGDVGDISELMCISLCAHCICTNDSTFSRLPRELSNTPGFMLRQGAKSGKEAEEIAYNAMLEGVNITAEGNELVYLSKERIESLSLDYETNGLSGAEEFHKTLEHVVRSNITENNAKCILDEIASLSLDYVEIPKENRKEIFYKKLISLYKLELYEDALDIADCILHEQMNNKRFHLIMGEMLFKTGYDGEAAIEYKMADELSLSNEFNNILCSIPDGDYYFITDLPLRTDVYQFGIATLAIILCRLGKRVTILHKPDTDYLREIVGENECIKDLSERVYEIVQCDLDEIENNNGLSKVRFDCRVDSDIAPRIVVSDIGKERIERLFGANRIDKLIEYSPYEMIGKVHGTDMELHCSRCHRIQDYQIHELVDLLG